MTVGDLLPVGIVALIPFGAFLHHRLNQLAQPLRLELADKGERLLAYRDLPREIRDEGAFMLDTAFGVGAAMPLAVLTMPFVAVIVLLFRRDILARALRDVGALRPEQAALYYDTSRLHSRLTTANHPLLSTILEAEFLVMVAFGLAVVALFKQPLPGKLDRSRMLNALEMSEANFLRRRAYAH
ncbi:MAG TPA: hypothetical protein VMU93_07185 [Caulobacteraceae bacterium]|nr:hypothetical protein [Caulobacteraceae bacterium]